MLENLKTGDLVIAPNAVKWQLLKEKKKKKQILNIKIMTLKEFKDNYFPRPDEKALYFLMQKHHLNYDIAKEYLNNI